MALRAYATTDHDIALSLVEQLGYQACLTGLAALLLETHDNLVVAGAAPGSYMPYLNAYQRLTAAANEVYGILNNAGVDIA